MTVIDSSAVVDLLLDVGVVDEVQSYLVGADRPAAPDVLVFEVLSALRRAAARDVAPDRAQRAVSRLGEMSIDLIPSIGLRGRVWELRDNFAAGDAMFVALAETLGEPLVTKDAPLARAAAEHTSIEVHLLTGRDH